MVVAAPLAVDMSRRHCIAVLTFVAALPSQAADHALIVAGLPGDANYADAIATQADAVTTAAASIMPEANVRTLRGDEARRESILAYLDELATAAEPPDRLLLCFLGHGSYDEVEYKFNLPGPDLTGDELASALDSLPDTAVVLVNTSSASGAIADGLQADNRVVVLATRSGSERHATRFGSYFAAALGDTAADTDKDGAITVAEAFRFANDGVADFFERNGQLATEHPVMSGGFADRFTLARLSGARPAPTNDAALAAMRASRDELRDEVEALRLSRDSLPADEYQEQLLQLMLEVARIEADIEAREAEIDAGN